MTCLIDWWLLNIQRELFYFHQDRKEVLQQDTEPIQEREKKATTGETTAPARFC